MFPELTTERLLLQQVLPEDQPFIFEGLSHPDVIVHYGVRYESFDATRAQMDWYNRLYKEGTGISWKIVNRQTGEKMGDVSVYLYKPEHNKAELGFWLLPPFWHQGFGLEAVQSAMEYWKKKKALHRLEAFVEEGNAASSRLLEKAGFEYEGTMKECEVKNGRYISLHVYAAILDESRTLIRAIRALNSCLNENLHHQRTQSQPAGHAGARGLRQRKL